MTKMKKRLLMIGFIFWSVAMMLFGVTNKHLYINLFGKTEWEKGYEYCIKQRMYKANKLDIPVIAGAGDQGVRKTYE